MILHKLATTANRVRVVGLTNVVLQRSRPRAAWICCHSFGQAILPAGAQATRANGDTNPFSEHPDWVRCELSLMRFLCTFAISASPLASR
jgi:hypothetical protein